jgi:DNA gyrase subunit A
MELMKKIAYFEEILSSEQMVLDIVVNELTAIKNKFTDPRRTEIALIDDEIDIEDLIEEEDCVYTLTHLGYIKRQPVSVYRAQRRGGRGITAQSVREEDFVETLFIASTHDYVLFFTSKGRLHREKGYQIPEAGRAAKGMNIVNLLPLEANEKVTAMIHVKEFEEGSYLFMVTRMGTVKRIALDALNTARKAGIKALSIDEGDELIAVLKTDGEQNIILATRNGRAICFNENDVRPMGRDAAGVRGVRLEGNDYVVGAARAREGGTVLTVTENGYGKRTPVEEYLRGPEDDESGDRRAQKRGGKGLANYNITQKTGPVAAVKVVDEDDDVMLISDDGVIIRMPASDINIYSRNTQGVILMRVSEGVHVISVARTEKAEEPEETPVGEPETQPEVGPEDEIES